MKIIDLSKENIKYVALGDSISEGFNGRYNFGFAGKYDSKKGVITGTSWPSYLARFIKSFNKSYLESFENFSLSGTRPEDWNYFLGIKPDTFNYKNSKEKIEYIQWLCDSKNNPERRRLKIQFNEFGKNNKNDFNYLIKSIKDANLITINIGANKVLPQIPFDKITTLIVDEKQSKKKILNDIKKIIWTIEDDLVLLFNKLKELNSNAMIYAVGYPSAFGPFWETINEFFKQINLNKNIINFCNEEMNKCIKKCAKMTNINYIDVNNVDFWSNNHYKLSNIFYEVHPTIFGYKKIAQDVLIKILIPNNKMSFLKKIPTFNDVYIQKDFGYYTQGINIVKSKKDFDRLINKIYGLNNENLFKITEVEQGSKFLESSLFFEQAIEPRNDPRLSINMSLKKSFFIILNDANVNNEEINRDINHLFETTVISEFIFKTSLGSKVVNKIQNKIDDYYLSSNDKMSREIFLKISFEELFEKDFLLWSIREFTKFWADKRKTKFAQNKQIFLKVVSDLLKKPHIKVLIQKTNEKVFKYIFKENLNINIDNVNVSYFIDEAISNISFIELMDIILDIYFVNVEELKNINNINELIMLFINDIKIKKFISKSIQNILVNIKFNDKLTSEIMERFSIPISKKNIEILKVFFNDVIRVCSKSNINVEVLQKAIFYMINFKIKKITSQTIFDFLLSLDKSDFWNKISSIKINKVNKESLENAVKALELIFSNIKIDGPIFRSLMELSNPKDLIDSSKGKYKIILLLKYLDKLSKTLKPLNSIFKIMIDNFYVSPLKSKDNLYYKAFFRLLLLLILVLRQLFQKNFSKNIFMDEKISIVKFAFQIAGYKNGKNKGIDNLMLNMFNEDGNYNLELIDIENHGKLQVLRLIYLIDENKKDMYNNIVYIKQVFDILKNGYIE